jgi:hypothetical protein
MRIERKKRPSDFTPIKITLERREEYEILVDALIRLKRYEGNPEAKCIILPYRPESSQVLKELLEKLETKNIIEVD